MPARIGEQTRVDEGLRDADVAFEVSLPGEVVHGDEHQGLRHDREVRVAELAAEGLTNREVAQALFVSEKTVETHLGRVYRKLDIKSRHALPGALADRRTAEPVA